MAYTLLQIVNLALTRAGVIQSDLSALTSNSQQQDVDVMVGAVNETVDHLFFIAGQKKPLATVAQSSTLTLATGTRSYAPVAGFVSLADDTMIDETNGQYLFPYPGGYEQMRLDQPIIAGLTGLPVYWAIDPTTGQFYLDVAPTSTFNGRIYKYLYYAETNYVVATPTATFPFTDELMRNAIPAMIQAFNRDRRPTLYAPNSRRESLAMASALLPRTKIGRAAGGPRP